MKIDFEMRRAGRKIVLAALGLAVWANGCTYFAEQPEMYPEKFAPPRQYHADVDQTDPELRRAIPYDEDLGEVYRTHRPMA